MEIFLCRLTNSPRDDCTNLGKLPIEQKGKLPSDENKNKNYKGMLPSQKRKFPIIIM